MVSFIKGNMLDAFDNIQILKFDVEKNEINSTKNSESISLLDELIKNFAHSFSKGTKPDENLEHKAKYIIDTVDQNKNGTVSIDELKEFDSSIVPSEVGAKINDLENNFKLYDIDRNGELSLAEIKKAIGKKQYSLQELKAMANENEIEMQDKETFGEFSYSFFQTAVNNYKKVDSNSEK